MAVVTSFTIASGTYSDEQDLLASLDTFITGTISGWTQLKVITDIATDKHIAYYSDGDSTRDRNTVSVRATADYLEFHAYTWFDTDTDTGHDDLYGTQTRIPTTTSSGTYWFIGNRDSVYVSIEHAGTLNPHLGGFGQFVSYYSKLEDPKPFFVFGQEAASTIFSSSRVRAWHPRSFGTAYNPLSPTTSYSGTVVTCRSSHYTAIEYGVSQARTGQPYFFEPIFTSISNASGYDIKGEIPGLKLIGIAPYSQGNIITVSGINLINGDYFIQDHTAANSVGWCIGRVFTV